MKRTALVLSLLSLIILTGCDGSGPNMNLMQPDQAYEIDTWMENSEVYEFTPKGNPNVTCVMLMLDNGKAMGLQCFSKG